MGALVESRVLALDRLLPERAANRVIFATLVPQSIDGPRNQIERAIHRKAVFLFRRNSRRRSSWPGSATFPGLLDPNQIVVINELVAIADEQIGSRFLHADADH